MSRQEEQFNVIYDGLITHIQNQQLDELKKYYKPKYDNSDVSNSIEIDDFSEYAQAEALEDAKNCFIDELRGIFPSDNKALIMIEKILENFSGR